MEITQLQAQSRQAHGSRSAQRLRREGKLPGIIYGHHETPQNVAVALRELELLLERGSHVIELSVDGATLPVLIKAVQYDPIGVAPIHIDFMRVDLNERVTVSVPLEFRGTPVGTTEGGIFEEQRVDLEVETLVTQIPDSIRVNVADLKIGQSLHVKDIPLPPNVKAVTPDEAIVCTVRAKVAEEEAVAPTAEGEESKQPEIITAKEREDKEEEEA